MKIQNVMQKLGWNYIMPFSGTEAASGIFFRAKQ